MEKGQRKRKKGPGKENLTEKESKVDLEHPHTHTHVCTGLCLSASMCVTDDYSWNVPWRREMAAVLQALRTQREKKRLKHM